MVHEVDAWRGFYGTKHIQAKPAPKVNIQGGNDIPGYSVRYDDGYISWSPAGAFEKAYHPENALDFAGALAALKDGYTVGLSTWLETEALVLVEGLLLHKISRHRVCSLPVAWVLATDWRIVGK